MKVFGSLKSFVARFLALCIFLGLYGCGGNTSQENSTLRVFHAGSLSIPIKEIAREFQKLHLGIDIQLEASGSVAAIRKITDLNRDCDVLALADAELIDRWLIPDLASWNLHFASNEMVIAYLPESKYSGLLDRDSWFEILSRDDVKYGRSDPNSDPCGYRTELCLKLASLSSSETKDYESLLEKDTRFIRPKATDLVALLETRSLDYIFEYASVAFQHGFEILHLPDQINLGNPEYSELYKKAEVEILGKKPGEKFRIAGTPMTYGVTVPKTSKNPELAKEFVRFLQDPEKGQIIMEKYGQRTLNPGFSKSSTKMPNFGMK